MLVLVVLNGVLFQGLVNAANSAFSVKDGGTEAGAVRPAAPERSGSPASLVPWEDLGLQGRNFVGTGPTPAQLQDFSGRPALEPIRVYTGLASAQSAGDRAALAVRDLQRAGGFDRKVLVVVTTTGTGWVDPAASDSLEYEWGGDTAMVAMQYSYLPSWLSFLVDQARARDAGRALFDAVYGAWAQLPLDRRPQLYVFGESLGTFGGEAAFSGLADIQNRTDGVLWAGPPNFNALWRSLVADRAPGVAGVAARVRGRADRPVRRCGTRPGAAARAVGPAARRLPAERLGPDRLVVPAADPGPSGLAARAAWAGRQPVDVLDPLRDVLAGHRRPGVRGGGAGRPRPQVRRGLRRRLGARDPAAGLDDGRHRAPPRPDRLMTGTSVRRMPDVVATGVVLVALVAINLTAHLLSTPWWLGPAEAAALVAFARFSGLTWSDLGLGRDRLGPGLRWALGAVAVVAAVYAVGVLLPLTRSAFQDSRYHLPLAEALFTSFVAIPLGTVLLEEIAFRSVLWGMLARQLSQWGVLLTTSVLFGLWHVLPAVHVGSANRGVSGAIGGNSWLVVTATVAFTALGGLVFGELRRRSGSVLAAMGAHWATNALGVLFGLLAWRLAG